MRAILQDRYGGTGTLRAARISRPEPGPEEVLVRVEAAAIDAGTLHLMAGTPYLIRPAFGFLRPRQPVPGRDLSGIVEEVGRSVTTVRPGDAVFGIGRGPLAEYALARPDKLAPLPSRLSHTGAAATPVSGLTALQALRDSARVQGGERVLIIGASGGVGTFAVQIARAWGAEITAVCSGEKMALVRRIGAHHVIDYRTEPLGTYGHDYDVIIDIAGRARVAELRSILTRRGRLVIVGGVAGRWLGIGRQLRAQMLSPFVTQQLSMFISKERREDLLVLAELIESGLLTPVVDRVVDLDDAPAAIESFRRGQVGGKVVIVPQATATVG